MVRKPRERHVRKCGRLEKSGWALLAMEAMAFECDKETERVSEGFRV